MPPPRTATVPVRSEPSRPHRRRRRGRKRSPAPPRPARWPGPGETAARGRGHPRADDRHRPPLQQRRVAQRPDHRRRRIQRPQRLRKAGLGDAEQRGAHHLALGDLSVGLLGGVDRRRAAGAAGQLRQRRQRLRRRPVAADQVLERHRPDALGARQTQAGEPPGEGDVVVAHSRRLTRLWRDWPPLSRRSAAPRPSAAGGCSRGGG